MPLIDIEAPAMAPASKKNRVIRVEDDLWAAATTQAAKDGIALAEVIRHYLRAYVDQG